MSAPLPPRMSAFADPLGDVVWAAVTALAPAEQQELYERLRDHLGEELLSEGRASGRVHRAIDGLRRASELLGHSPSINQYRRLRKSHPDEPLPPDGSIRSSLGGGWNDCLRIARLDSVADGDAMESNLGTRMTAADCITALRACAEDLGVVPSASMYRGWAGRPDVRRRPGRRSVTVTPIVRHFGNFSSGLAAAGLIKDGTSAMTLANGVVRMGDGRMSDSQIGAALSEVRDRLGHVPRSNEYSRVREQIIAESAAAGSPRTIACAPTLIYRYGSWNGALAKFGMEPFRSKFDAKPFSAREYNTRLTVFSQAEMLAAIREAAQSSDEGSRIGLRSYVLWRKAEIERSLREGGTARRLPAPETIRAHLGSWANALKLAFGQMDE